MGEKRTERITLKLTNKEYEFIKSRCNTENNYLTVWIRELILSKLDYECKNPELSHFSQEDLEGLIIDIFDKLKGYHENAAANTETSKLSALKYLKATYKKLNQNA